MWPLPKLLNISTLQIRTIDHEMIYRGVLALLGGPTAYGVQTAQKMSERGGGGGGGGGGKDTEACEARNMLRNPAHAHLSHL